MHVRFPLVSLHKVRNLGLGHEQKAGSVPKKQQVIFQRDWGALSRTSKLYRQQKSRQGGSNSCMK
jgi:hypothetical protein